MKNAIKNVFNKLGYSISKNRPLSDFYPDMIETEFWEIYNFCKPFSMTSIERMYGLYNAVNYVLSKNIKGHFVECGVWRGGSAMLIAKMLVNRNIHNRKIYLYDTFEGMTAPSEVDITLKGELANQLMEESIDNKEESVWCLATLEDVKQNLFKTKFPIENLVYIKGKVEDTLPQFLPDDNIALLRLDTDWYESTKHELETLFPLLVENGVLIIDDYGYWQGCRKAVDEYFENQKISVLMNRLDHTGRMIIKPGLEKVN